MVELKKKIGDGNGCINADGAAVLMERILRGLRRDQLPDGAPK